MQNSDRVTNILAKIQTQCLWNTNLEHYTYTSLPGIAVKFGFELLFDVNGQYAHRWAIQSPFKERLFSPEWSKNLQL
jgi:hypothetical protein